MATTRKTKASRQETGLVLTEEEYKSLRDLLRSPDKENHTVAQRIIWGCDIEKSIYWLWKLAKRYPSDVMNNRLKASREFREAANWWGLYRFNEEAFATWLVRRKGWMTNEIFGYLKRGIIELIERRADNHFFDVTVYTSVPIRKYDDNVKAEIIVMNT